METCCISKLSQSGWKSCENCSNYIYKKDARRHEKICSDHMITEVINSLPYGFISDNTFYAPVVTVKGEIILPDWARPTILMNPLTMKLFGFVKGGCVAVVTDNVPTFFHVLPRTDLYPSSISFPRNQIIKFPKRTNVSVHRYEDFFEPSGLAREIQVCAKDVKQFMSSEEFRICFRQLYSKVIIHCGMTLSFNYSGSNCELKIVNTKGYFEDMLNIENYTSNPSEKIHTGGEITQVCDEFLNLSIQDKINHAVDDTNLKNTGTVKVSTQDIKCSTPISSKKVPLNISTSSECSLISFSDSMKNEKHPLKMKCYQISENTKISFIESSKSDLPKTPLFKDIGGLTKQLHLIRGLLQPFLSPDLIFSNKKLPKGILLSGPSGTGKSFVLNTIVNECLVPVIVLKGINIFDKHMNSVTYFRKVFKDASASSPSVLIIDDLHLLYNEDIRNQTSDERKIIMDELPSAIEKLLGSKQKKVIVIAATNKPPEYFDSALVRHGRFEKIISFGIPTIHERRLIFDKLLGRRNHVLSEEEIVDLVHSSPAYTGGDLAKVCREAEVQAKIRCKNKIEEPSCLLYKDFSNLKKTPSGEKEKQISWDNIGGMWNEKEKIKDMIYLPLLHSDKFEKLGISPSRSILMYGPSGCAKTMIANAIASESKINFLSVKGPELFNKYVGESERAVHNLFKKAQASAPCVIFFDEFDSLAARRGDSSGGSDVGTRVLSQLLVEIDGIDIKKGLCIIAATNRPDLIDPAFLRPGRFDQLLYIGLPDESAREEIFKIILQDVPISNGIDIKFLIDETEGYTGSEIANVYDEAGHLAVKDADSVESVVVTMAHFKEALNIIKPKTSKRLLKIYNNFKSERRHVRVV